MESNNFERKIHLKNKLKKNIVMENLQKLYEIQI